MYQNKFLREGACVWVWMLPLLLLEQAPELETVLLKI